MAPLGEQTPLLRRVVGMMHRSNNNRRTPQQYQQGGGDHDQQNDQQNHQHHHHSQPSQHHNISIHETRNPFVGTTTTTSSTTTTTSNTKKVGYESLRGIGNAKEDRRFWFIRYSLRFGELYQQLTYQIIPPMETNDCYEDILECNTSTTDESWSCHCGTREEDGIWLNTTDRAGCLMAIMVWVLIIYSAMTMIVLAQNHHMSAWIAIIHCTICTMALLCHVKTQLTDPGSIPNSAVPPPAHYGNRKPQSNKLAEMDLPPTMCSVCQTYKPIHAHHCRICNRCISRMDHHCPWMNNCIGILNFKHFILFLFYTWTGSTLSLLVFGINYFACTNEQCEFNMIEIQLVRAMTLICFGSLAFTTSMIMNVVYGIVTGIGTIDRLKLKANDTWQNAIEEPTPLSEIFGIGSYYTWLLPIDPILEYYDDVVGHATRHRLLRQQAAIEKQYYENNKNDEEEQQQQLHKTKF